MNTSNISSYSFLISQFTLSSWYKFCINTKLLSFINDDLIIPDSFVLSKACKFFSSFQKLFYIIYLFTVLDDYPIDDLMFKLFLRLVVVKST